MSAYSVNAFQAAGGTRLKVGREIVWGFLVVLLFFGGILVWAGFAPLSTAAIAPGVVTVDGYRKTVQHLEGGIVEQILVREGSRVEGGQALITLQRLASETEFNLLQSQRALAAAAEARLLAEQQGAASIAFPDWLMQRLEQAEIRQAVEGQNDIFEARRVGLRTQLDRMTDEMAEAESELESYRAKSKALDRQRRLVRREVREFRAMAEKGLIPRTKLYATERLAAEADASISSNLATIAGVEQRIGQIEAKMSALVDDRVTEVAERLRQKRDELIDIEHRIGKARDKLDRTIVRAPVAGIVVNLQVHTVGGVIKQGQGLMDLVPADEELIVEAQIDPKDRDMVKAGMKAEIRLSAFNQRAFRPITGEVVHVSADAVQQQGPDAGGLKSFYRSKIRFVEDPAEVLGGTQIQPGMQADVLVVTGERTALEYFVAPMFRSFSRAMHEQ